MVWVESKGSREEDLEAEYFLQILEMGTKSNCDCIETLATLNSVLTHRLL